MFEFSVVTRDRDWRLRTTSERFLKNWIEGLQAAIPSDNKFPEYQRMSSRGSVLAMPPITAAGGGGSGRPLSMIPLNSSLSSSLPTSSLARSSATNLLASDPSGELQPSDGLVALKNEVVQLRSLLIDREREISLLHQQLKSMEQSYNELYQKVCQYLCVSIRFS